MRVTILPLTVEARGGGPTLHTGHTPTRGRRTFSTSPGSPEVLPLRAKSASWFPEHGLSRIQHCIYSNCISGPFTTSCQTLERHPGSLPLAFPATLGHSEQWRVQAVGMVANVTVITEQQARRVRGLAANLAHNTLHTTPAFEQHHLGDLVQRERCLRCVGGGGRHRVYMAEGQTSKQRDLYRALFAPKGESPEAPRISAEQRTTSPSHSPSPRMNYTSFTKQCPQSDDRSRFISLSFS